MSAPYSDALVEKAAFACFHEEVRENYMRMLLLVVLPVIKEHKKISVNRLFSVVRNIAPVTEVKELLPVIAALDTPFKCVSINSYHRNSGGNRQPITEVTYLGSEVWESWVEHTLKAHPEMAIWVERTHGTAV